MITFVHTIKIRDMNKKLIVFASAMVFGLFAFVSIDAVAKSKADLGIEVVADDCDNCGKADCKSCSAKKEGSAEAAPGTKKACCAGGEGEKKSCSEKKSGKSESKTETKTEEKKK